MQKIQITATLLIPILLLFAALYVVFTAGDDLDFTFLSPDRWFENGWVHPDATAPNWQRGVFLAMWLLPVVFGLLGVYCALRLMLLIRRGVLFDTKVCALLRAVGIFTALSGLSDFVATLFSPQVLSWTNPSGPVPFEWFFDSEPAGLIVCGGGFYLIGWILAEARRLADENEGFI